MSHHRANLEAFMFMLSRLMEQDQPSMQGAVRSAIWLIGQVPQRRRWADPAHLKGRFLALAGLRYVSLVVTQTTAQNLPCQQTPKPVKRFNINMKASSTVKPDHLVALW
ncbi:MAG: hypothetical protein GY742_12255 [Hyphomicrobiales bacterium]|nr:hypothetical protein [Hyphomicrobiales bacterium]